MTSEMTREEIVGHCIQTVKQTPWQEYDGTSACEVAVVLDTGAAFVLGDEEEEPLTPVTDLSGYRAVELPEEMPPCDGEVIVAVLKSDLWPAIGLHLGSGRILTVRDHGTPYRVGAFLWKPRSLEDEEAVDYWSD